MRFRSKTGIYFSLFCTVSILLVSLACQKKKESSLLQEQTSITEANSLFNKEVGGPIDSATAKRWKRNLALTLAKKTPSAYPATAFYLPAQALRSLIANNKVTGVCFYFGIDATGSVHVMPVAVNNKGSVIYATTLISSTGQVSWEIAKQWQKDFRQQYPNSIWGYFSGSIVLERLLANSSDTVRVELGMTDEGTTQIMLSDATLDEPLDYFDRTRPIPVSPSASINYME